MQKIYNLNEVAHIMNGRPDDQKIKVLKSTILKFLMFAKQKGYTLDGGSHSLSDFFEDHKSGAKAADNLIRTLWVIIDAETIVDVDAKKN